MKPSDDLAPSTLNSILEQAGPQPRRSAQPSGSSMTIDEALEISTKRFLSLDEVARLCPPKLDAINSTLDTLALEVAGRYLRGAIPFTSADSLMNDLFSHAVQHSDLPPTFMRVYEAFDQGEYHHPDDTDGVEPEDAYTKPMLLSLFAEGLLPDKLLERTREK